MEQGVVSVYYGEGHGKSTAALGKALLEAGCGKNVVVIQFLKSKEEREISFLTRLEPELKFFRFAKSEKGFDELSDEEKAEEYANLKNGFNYGKKVISTGECDMLVMDEILGLVDHGVITMEDIDSLLAAKPEDVTIVFTGRVLGDDLRSRVDEIYNIASEK